MRSIMPADPVHTLQTPWTEQLFQETAKGLCQVDIIEAMQNVMFYATLLFQGHQEQQASEGQDQVRLPLAWQWGGEEEIVANVKRLVPAYFIPVLEYSLALSAMEGRDSFAMLPRSDRRQQSEGEMRELASEFIRYVQERLQFPDEGSFYLRRLCYI